jgi:predicted Holliday junction resolvase-like endonuclease
MFEIPPLFVFAAIMVAIYLLSLLQSSADIASLREQLSAEREAHQRTYARMIKAEWVQGKSPKSQART